MKKIKVILIGAGQRGKIYTDIGEKNGYFEVVAVAEPLESRRNEIRDIHKIPSEMCFAHWNELLSIPKFADAAIITTMDREHFEPAMLAIKQGYDLLLEKPISPYPLECMKLSEAAHKYGRKVVVCHVLRFAPFFKKLRDIIDDGLIGQVVSVVHTEGVGFIHFCNSFIRGNWRNSIESSPMILQKSCHDMDILQWLLGSDCKRIHSFGSLLHFTEKNKPEGSPKRCIDGCPHGEECYYNAVRMYLENKKNINIRRHITKLTDPSDADVEQALRTSVYGLCVYNCDNDVVDNQTVNMEFESGATAVFTMSAYNRGGRSIRIMGTKGEIFADASDDSISYYSFKTRQIEQIPVTDSTGDDSPAKGHGGGDEGIIADFYEYIANGRESRSLCDIEVSARNHLIAFAAEESRVTGKVIDMKEYEGGMTREFAHEK